MTCLKSVCYNEKVLKTSLADGRGEDETTQILGRSIDFLSSNGFLHRIQE